MIPQKPRQIILDLAVGIADDLNLSRIMVRQHRRHEPADGMPGEIRRNITDPQPPFRIATPVGPLAP